MPMILNNTRLHSRRRSSMSGYSTSCSRSGGSEASFQQLSDWSSTLTGNPSSATFASKTGGASVQSTSLSSSGTSTPPTASPPQSRRRRVTRGHVRPSEPTISMDDSWGQFVDTAEAEKELVRHSKILSRKETPSIPRGYHQARRSIC